VGGIYGSTYREGRRRIMWCKFGGGWRRKVVRETMARIFRPYVAQSHLPRCEGTKIWMDKRFSSMDAEVGIRRISGCNSTEQRQRRGICK
jgi:hypothetical protein